LYGLSNISLTMWCRNMDHEKERWKQNSITRNEISSGRKNAWDMNKDKMTGTAGKQNVWGNKYILNWIQHSDRVEPERLPKHMLNYRPRGWRDLTRPRIRWSWRSEQGEGPNPWKEMIKVKSLCLSTMPWSGDKAMNILNIGTR